MKNEFYVSRGGIPCVLDFGLIRTHGALVPDRENPPTVFGLGHDIGGKRAGRAIDRTVRLIKQVEKSLLRDSPRLAALFSWGDFKVEHRKSLP